MRIVLAVVLFLLLIVFHEFGHFIVAKKSGIKVNEFAVGMGPLIYSMEKGETTYSFRAIPIGGYCAMEGEDDESSDPRSFDNAPASKRFLTILAGPVANLIIAVLVFTIVGVIGGVVTTEVSDFIEDSPAKAAGIEKGDEILKINDQVIDDFNDISKVVNDFYKDKDFDKEITVLAKRNGKDLDFAFKPKVDGENTYIGIIPARRTPGFFEAIGLGFKETGRNVKMIFTILGRLFTGKLAFGALSGPVGVLKELGNQAQNGLANLLYFLAYISVNLAVFNLLPIPALDGSKLLTSGIEIITGKKINKKLEEKITMVGFFILLGLILVVSIKDIVNLFR
ncbi:RIP metalloprotease RseP [Anaerococcus murdochii]|uniref:Zinc metalloprotease n=1 Tax=Anaerococcus murdochii TaxID=411577 RepID=A0ABS7SWG3_9FIRM|nr:RIP metalloprotease RseP [Anaerococcus murdochii]MBZ2385852.1 RIP metalloprotease RseP [Anaerococcus murdochii]